MTRPIEAIVAEAQQRLANTGRLDVAAYLSAYPEHAAELQEVLPVMLTVHQEKRWQAAETASRTYALGLFADLVKPASQESAITVGELFGRERQEFQLTIEEQARRSGLPVKALVELEQNATPVSALDNASIKSLADRIAAPFGTLLKEIKRHKSLFSVTMQSGGVVFTREKETSSVEEQQALRDKVRKSTRIPPEEK
ncbi:MAG TPA: hypothetical protein VNT01_16160 [Symbiobacteriaceae bacterium]|nr:hypothetical protein [Symbiobacteriaceae bacterium]